MNAEKTSAKEMGVFGRIVGIFTSPRETFESIDQKPTWLVPFLIIVIVMIVLQFLAMDIAMKDRLADMQARDMPADQFERARDQMESWKYVGFAFIPVGMLVVWVIISGILLFGGNTMMGGETKFKKVFSVLAWSGLIGLVGEVIKTLLILSKGTTRGVVLSLAFVLPTPELGQSPPVLYRLLSQFGLFTIWELVLWIIGLAVIYRFTTKKSATLVLSLWAIWIVISVTLGSVLGGIFGG